MIYNVDVIPGLSDHDIITAKLLHHAFVKKSKGRKVFTFRRGKSANVLQGLSRQCEKFLLSVSTNLPSVESMWSTFKDMLMRNARKHFPRKLTFNQAFELKPLVCLLPKEHSRVLEKFLKL